MSADTTEQDGGGGEDLRARYLPVSRKELRRRREAELAGKPEAAGEADEPQAEESSEEVTDEHAENQPEAEASVEEHLNDESSEAPVRAEEQTDVDLPAVTDGLTLENGDEADKDDEHDDPERDAPEADDGSEGEEPEADEGADVDPISEETAPEGEVTLEPLEDDSEETPEEVLDEETGDLDEEDPDEVIDQEDPESADDPDLVGDLDSEADDDADEEQAPVPASRRSRRLLRGTDTFNVLDEEKLRELDEINQQVAEKDDPAKVDQELLKKQQAMAAKAMQANQERLRQEQEEREEAERQERRRRRRERPESEVITRKALRAYMESDQESEETYATGEIEPVQARGAHGLELDEIVEHSSRQASRQSMLLWLVIILAVLLVVAVGVILYFVL